MTAIDESRSPTPRAPQLGAGPPPAFSVDELRALAARDGLRFDDSVLGPLVAALRAGKHVILTGPPGTGKSTLAVLVAELAERTMMSAGYLSATATSQWTVADTVGVAVDAGAGPTFRSGVVTQAIESGRWLLIDELNRANIDQAFGELFSVLAGQAVVLPHPRTELSDPLSLVPFGADPPPATEPIPVPKWWRIIATMNSADRGLLFTLSRALMRRFALVHVTAPEDAVYQQLLDGSVVERLLPLRQLLDLGPALYVDAAEYASARLQDGVTESTALLEAFNAYFLPQLDGLDASQAEALLGVLDATLGPEEQSRARRALADLGVTEPLDRPEALGRGG